MRYLEAETTYILGNFDTGDTVTIDVYQLSDNSKIVNAAGCTEISTTGKFKYSFSQGVASKTEYLWVMTNSVDTQQGKIILGGYPDSIKDETDKIQTGIIDVKGDYKATGFATASALTTHDNKLDVVDGIVDRILKATEIKQCTVNDASASTLTFVTNLTETSNQFWKRGVVLITSGNDEGQIRAIENYNGSTKAITLKTPLDTAPANGDTFIILTERKYLTPDIEDIIDTIWDEPASSHVVSGSFGLYVNKIKSWVSWLRSLL